MTGRIIPMRGDPHQQVQNLLPWFVTGQLESDDLKLVESHLAECAGCRFEADVERRLRDEVAALPDGLEVGWARMEAKLDAAKPRTPLPAGFRRLAAALGRRFAGSRGAWLGWGLAIQSVALAAAVGLAIRPTAPPAAYRALGAEPASARGDVVVIFRPQTREVEMRAALRAAGARLVDGPTAANGYVLDIPAQRRASAVSGLRRDPGVLLAEPIDSDGPS
jgi:hypothetical protein